MNGSKETAPRYPLAIAERRPAQGNQESVQSSASRSSRSPQLRVEILVAVAAFPRNGQDPLAAERTGLHFLWRLTAVSRKSRPPAVISG